MTKWVTVQGGGNFEFPVVRVSHHQRFLEQLCGGRNRTSARPYYTAISVVRQSRITEDRASLHKFVYRMELTAEGAKVPMSGS